MPTSFRRRRGGIMVLTVLSFTVMLAAAGFVVDLAGLYWEQEKLQAAVDAAALAGAQELPSAGQAQTVAGQYLAANNESAAGAVYTLSADNTRLTVKQSKQVATAFTALLGQHSVTVSAQSTGEQTGPGGPFDSAIFSGSSAVDLSLNGGDYTIKGPVHTNRNLIINGSHINISKAAEAVGTVTTNGTGVAIGTVANHADTVAMPDLSNGLQAAAQAAGQVYVGSKTLTGTLLTTSAMYVKGTVTAMGSGINLTGSLIADGTITVYGSGATVTANNQVAFYSKTGDVILNGSNQTFNGVLYAPNGRVIINGSNVTINGTIVGAQVLVNGSGLVVNRDDNAIKVLGGKHVKLTI